MSTRTLDYGTNRPFPGIIGQPRHLAWPVHAYRVTIPASFSAGGDHLNPFERVILRILDAVGGLDEHALAAETCLPADLVRSVTLRLRDEGLINDDNLVIDRQRGRWEENPGEQDYTSALVFRELVGGRTLPYVHVLDQSNPIKTKIVERGIRRISPKSAHADLGAPSTSDVISAIAEMKKRTQAHAQTTRMPTIEQIRVGRQPEEYLLDCQIAIQSRDADFRISDPFGTGFSRILEAALSRRLQDDERLQEWMTDWRRNLSIDSSPDKPGEPTGEPFDTLANRSRYPELVLTLKPRRAAQHRSVENIYASLEWALFYTCQARSAEPAMLRLKLEAGPNFSPWLSDVAASIGLAPPRYGFRPIPDGKFVDYQHLRAEMDTVLAIALLQADAESEHPLRSIAQAHPDFILRLGNLKADRGKWAHGQRSAGARDVELASDPFMREVVSTLLPEVRFDATPHPTQGTSPEDLRLDAHTNLLAAFGYQTFSNLGTGAQESLISAEQFWLAAEDGDDARGFLSDLYSTLQAVLRGFVSGVAGPAVSESDYVTQARRNADAAGFGPLPKPFASVRTARIRDTLRGEDRSVGALVIALLLVTSETARHDLAAAQPGILAAIADIVERRGHGNQPAPMLRREAQELRAKAIATIETLLDLPRED